MSRPKIYTLDENYFDCDLNERSSYLLGLIFSDGHLNYLKGRLEFTFKSEDVELLEFIKNELKTNVPIKTINIKNINYARVGISSIRLIRTIINKYGLPYTNKSKNNLVFPQLDVNVINHFLRGFFDGDGSIWNGGDSPSAGFTGGERFLTYIKNFFIPMEINFQLRYRYTKRNKNSCQLETHGSLQVDKLGDYLYKNSTFFLKRKKEKFDACKLMADKFKTKSLYYSGNEKNIEEFYQHGMKQIEIAKHLKLNFSTVRSCVQRLRKIGILT